MTTLYNYRCPKHGVIEIRHPMSEVRNPHFCPKCAALLSRVFVPIPHRWPAQYRPGFEDSGQRMILDPEFQARTKDEMAKAKEAHVARTAKEKTHGTG